MAIVVTNLASGTPGPVSSFNTASVSPAAGALILFTIFSRKSGGSGNQPTATGDSMTWTAVDSGQKNEVRVTTFRSLSFSPGSGALTGDFASQAQSECWYSIDQFAHVDTGGVNGLNAIVQHTNASAVSASTQTINLSAFGNPLNVAYGAFSNPSDSQPSNGSGFTLLFRGAQGYLCEYELNQTAVSYTINASGQDTCGVAMEIKAGFGGGSFLFNLL